MGKNDETLVHRAGPSDVTACCAEPAEDLPKGDGLTEVDDAVTCEGRGKWGKPYYWTSPTVTTGVVTVHLTTGDGRRFAWDAREL